MEVGVGEHVLGGLTILSAYRLRLVNKVDINGEGISRKRKERVKLAIYRLRQNFQKLDT